MDKLITPVITPARLIYAGAIAALGVENLICAHVSQSIFAKNPPAVPVLPFVPAIPALAYLAGLVFLATGLTIAANFWPRLAAIFLGFFFYLCVVVLLVPKAVRNPRDLNVRTCVFEELALVASAFTLAACLRKQESSRTHGSSFIEILTVSAPYLFAASSIVFGITHFLVLPFIATLVTAWIPGRLFWAVPSRA